MAKTPFVSFIIPTLNAGEYLEKCLKSIQAQDYAAEKFEVIVIDGGSQDKTIQIARQFGAKILKNSHKDAESGKAIGIKTALGEIIALLDADNQLVSTDWLSRMIQPLSQNPELFGVESNYFVKKGDSLINQYCMLLHIADPFARFLAPKLKVIKKGNYLEFQIDPIFPYPLGANGFLWRRSVIDAVGEVNGKFEESDFSARALKRGFTKFARVPGAGIYHDHVRNIYDFLGKRFKIGNKFLNRRQEGKSTWISAGHRQKFLLGVLYCTTLIGPLVESLKEYRRTHKTAWLLHPLMCFLTVTIYGFVFLQRKLNAFWIFYFSFLGRDAGIQLRWEILNMLPQKPNALFLDCGCDNGEFSLRMAEKVETKAIFGVDRNSERAALAEEKGVKKVILADLNRPLPIKSRSFNIITAIETIEHLYNLDCFLRELKRLLEPDGYLIVSTENLAAWHNLLALFLGNQPYTGPYLSRFFPAGHHPLNLYQKEKFRSQMPPHTNVMTTKALGRLLKDYGFKVEKVRGVGYYPFFGLLARICSWLDKNHAVYTTVRARQQTP